MKIIGNKDIIMQINIAMKSAYEENRSLPHLLLSGAAGCGKTTTARYIASLTNAKFINVSYDAIKTRKDVLRLMKQFDHTGYDKYGSKLGKEQHIRPSIVFIDEIHGLSVAAQEYLGILMEEWVIPISAKDAKVDFRMSNEDVMRWCPQFTLIGATTNDGKLTKPFRDRFKLRFVFTPYNLEDSINIVLEHANSLNINITKEGAEEIAKRGRGVGRILVRLLERCRDVMVAFDQPELNKELAIVTFDKLGIDAHGLTSTDVKLLLFLHTVADPVGLENLSVHLNESPKVLSETIEPYLIQQGFILRSGRGRKITSHGKRYLLEQGHLTDAAEPERYDIPRSYNRRL